MAEIIWSLQSVEDLKNIYRFIEHDSKINAIRVISGIRKSTQLLKQNVFIGKELSQISKGEYRQLVHQRFLIIYRVKAPDLVEIITAHHSSQNLIGRKI